MNTRTLKRTVSNGFTLVELLISMLLGIFIVGAVAGMYLETSKNMAQDDELSRLQENARYVVDLLHYEIASSGFLGGLQGSNVVSSAAITTDCGNVSANWALDISMVMEMVNDYSGIGAPISTSGTAFSCLTPAEIQTNSDIITIKRTASTPTLHNGEYSGAATADLNQWYLKVFDFNAYSWSYLTSNIQSVEATAGSTFDYWEYYAKIYFLRNYSQIAGDGIPIFCEARLTGDIIDNRCLVEGVEEMHFEFGVDSDDDNVADQYKSSPTSTDLSNAVSVRMHLLMRSVNEIVGYTNNKQYELGGRKVAAYNDGYIRKVFTTTIKLRNQLN